VGPRAGMDGCGKSRPTGIRSPDRPARSESLYRLSYRGTQIRTKFRKILIASSWVGRRQENIDIPK
jgi:hypothetical protein